MEAIEVSSGDEIRAFVAGRLKNLRESFSILTVGHITKFVEPVNITLGVAEATQIFSNRPELSSLPVEGDRGVIGLVHKNDLLKKKSAFTAMTNPPVEKFLDRSAFFVDASENCEKAMGSILKRDREKLYDDFMIYERGRYFGIGTFADLSRNIAEIREADLLKARKTQEFLITRNWVTRPGLSVKRYLRMAHEIGGDYLLCAEISPQLSMLSCYDVAGKGTAAALLTSTLSSFFSTLKESGTLATHTPASIVSELNSVIGDQTPEEIFVAAAFAFVDHEKRAVSFFNCGSSPVYVFYTDAETGKTKGRIINPHLRPLGIDAFTDIKGLTCPISQHFRIFIHTDGLTDAVNEMGNRYGEENLRKFLYPRCMKSSEEIVADLDKEITEFSGSAPQADDITVLVAEIS
ncbi:MAG TPA: SpoIIE family protein phosphatase [Spirochaetia bacterium]|nr:SpoIIE family protein phosphatase [Spirochaetia bacterium]